MIKIENTEVMGWEHAIRGMRNPMNSWEKSDSLFIPRQFCDEEETWALAEVCAGFAPVIKTNDHTLMMNLAHGGPVHAKYRRMITVYLDITAPLYWWKEFDTYKVGTVANSCSTMHKIHTKEFTLEDFSCEHLSDEGDDDVVFYSHEAEELLGSKDVLSIVLEALNQYRAYYLETHDKKYWWQMIQLLPTSYNQKRTVMLNYEVLAAMYESRKNHKLDCWRDFCAWIETLPYSELIIGERECENNGES